LLFSNRLVSPQLTKEMKKILSDPALEHKFVKGLARSTGCKNLPQIRYLEKLACG
jgi:hypothetical protein